MDKHTLSHENDGAQGSGFTGKTGSNNYSELPRSSNAALGIDPSVSTGITDVEEDDDDSTLASWGVGTDISTGTVPARRVEDIGPSGTKGKFGVSALSGTPPAMLNQDAYLGPGARKAGTAAQFGEPGRGGSMALAINGLSGNTTGADKKSQPQGKSKSAVTEKSMADATKGLSGSGGKS